MPGPGQMPPGHRMYLPNETPRVLRVDGPVAHIVPPGGADGDAVPVAYEHVPALAELVAQAQQRLAASAAEYEQRDPVAAAAAEYGQQDPLAATAVEHQQRLGGPGASAPIADATRAAGLDPSSPFMRGLAGPATATDATPAPVQVDAVAGRTPQPTFAQQTMDASTQAVPQVTGQARQREGVIQQAMDGGDPQQVIDAVQGRTGVVQAPPAPAAGGPAAPPGARVVNVPGAPARGGGGRAPGLSGDQREYLSTFDAERRSVETQGDIARGEGRMRSDMIQGGIERQTELEAQAAEAENARQGVLRRHDESLARMRRELATQREDPGRYWRDAGTGARILGGIAVGLGAAGAALTGGPNTALEILQDAVDEDIEAQRTNLAERRADYSAAERERENVEDRFQDERMREEARRVAAWDEVERRIQALAAQSQGEMAQANAQQMLAGVQRNRAEAEMRFQQLNREAAARAAAARARASQSRQVVVTEDGIQIEVTPRNALQVQEMLREGRARQAEAGGGTIPGLEVIDQARVGQLSPTDRSRVAQLASTYGDLRGAVDEMIRLRNEHGMEVFGNAEMGNQRRRAMRALSVLEEAGALGDQEREYYESQIPDPSSADPRTLGRLEALQSRVRQQGEERFRPFGYRPGGGGASAPTGASSFRPAGG